MRGDGVGFYRDRSPETIALILGVWHAGGVVVPISPDAPVRMLTEVVVDSAIRVIATVEPLKDRVSQAVKDAGLERPPIMVTEGLQPVGDNTNTFRDIGGLDADESTDTDWQEGSCYIIYTSGSQGRPKGVIGAHAGLEHYVKWQAKEFAIIECDRFSQVAPLSFDFSLKEIFVPLICGACVCIADRGTVIDPAKFIEWVGDNRITVTCWVPTLLRSILHASRADDHGLESLRYVLISGDVLRWDDVIAWRNRFGNGTSLFNLYGPTESTIIKLFYRIPQARCGESAWVPIGRPIEGAKLLILDEDDRPCSSGETGEIVILSEWVARGYVNGGGDGDKAFGRCFHEGIWTRVYRTGDLGRMLSDSNVEFVGRRDRQVKVRGYRVELDEIERMVGEHPEVRDIAVVMSGKPDIEEKDGPAEIVCYFTAGSLTLTEKELRAYAKDRLLPQVLSMVRVSLLDRLPLSVNGKVDRLALESRQLHREKDLNETPLAAVSAVQERILAVWEELLGIERIDAEANFFELGGNSILAIRLLRRLREEVHPEVRLEDVFGYPSISGLSARVRELVSRGQLSPLV